MADRYCTNCGERAGESQRFCGNCGSPTHATARVATPEADVPTPPPPQQHQSATGDGRETRGPMLALVAVFLVLGIWATAQEMPSALREGAWHLGSVLGLFQPALICFS